MNSHLQARKGFTLVEILVAITVIAILGAMLMAGLFPMLGRAKEAAIQTEMKQIEQAIEQFHIKYGVYPPSFTQFRAIGNDAQRVAEIKRYLNRISRNHQESDGRILEWWNERGQLIDPRLGHDLVFWLSGLFKNKQFPLTGSAGGQPPAAFSLESANEDRELFYPFKPSQLKFNLATGVASYSQEADALAPFVYVDAPNYLRDPAGHFWGYWQRLANDPNPDANPTPMEIANGTVVFPNPTTFQLVVCGRDRQTGDGQDISSTTQVIGRNVRRATLFCQDNIVNFANGRLDAYVNSISD